MDANQLQTQLDGLKENLKQAFSTEMKASIKKDIEEVETKMSLLATKASVDEIDAKLAKVINAQDEQLKLQNDAKTAAAGKEVKSFEQLLGESMEENTDM